MVAYTDLARLLVGTALLAFASWTDWRWRRAPNVLWIAMAAAGVLLLAVDAALDFETVRAAWPYLVAAPVIAAVYYVLYHFHLIAGGADMKALAAMAVLAPVPVALAPGVPAWTSPFPTSVVAFVDALLVFLVIPVAMAVANAARGHVGALMFVAVKRDVAHVDRGHWWLMERVGEDGKIRRSMFPSKQAYDLEEEKAKLLAAGHGKVWVTPKVPFMIPLLGGWVAAFLAGDVLFGIMQSVAR